MKKISFSDLDNWLKVAVIMAYITLSIWAITFVYYLIIGITEGV